MYNHWFRYLFWCHHMACGMYYSVFHQLSTWFPFYCVRFSLRIYQYHDDVIKWKYFPRYWPFVRGIHRSPVNSPHKGQWRGALMFTLISAWINAWVNNREAGDLRRHRAHYDAIVMYASRKYVIIGLDTCFVSSHGLWLQCIPIIIHMVPVLLC